MLFYEKSAHLKHCQLFAAGTEVTFIRFIDEVFFEKKNLWFKQIICIKTFNNVPSTPCQNTPRVRIKQKLDQIFFFKDTDGI